jgi:hypothetical protein
MTRLGFLGRLGTALQVRAPRPALQGATKPQVFLTVQPSYQLAWDAAAYLVWVNGLLMLEGQDYQIAGKSLRFTGQVIEDPIIIQILPLNVGKLA